MGSSSIRLSCGLHPMHFATLPRPLARFLGVREAGKGLASGVTLGLSHTHAKLVRTPNSTGSVYLQGYHQQVRSGPLCSETWPQKNVRSHTLQSITQ